MFLSKTLIKIGLFAAGFLLLAGCGEEPQAEKVLRPVRYEAVYATGGDRMRTFSGVTRAGQESRLSFKVAGTVKKVHIKVGDDIAPGTLIAELDPSDYRLQVQQAEASLESARALERNAASGYERVRRLYENNSTSRNELDAARAGYESAQAQVTALAKQLELARLQVRYTRLTAPASGAIASLDVEVNENIQPGQTIVQLSSDDELEVEVAIPGLLISQLREGQRVVVACDAMPGGNFPATITEVGVSSIGMATTFPVTVRLDKINADIRPGMASEVTFKFTSASKRERFLVPSFAVSEDMQGRFVFVVEPGEAQGTGIVHRRNVTIGDLTDEGIEIFDGLIDGNRVVTAGMSKLQEGQVVKFQFGEER